MQQKRYCRSEIAEIVRRTRADLERNVPLREICQQHQVSVRTLRRWMRESERALEVDPRLSQLQLENRRLRRAIDKLELNNRILEEAVRGNF